MPHIGWIEDPEDIISRAEGNAANVVFDMELDLKAGHVKFTATGLKPGVPDPSDFVDDQPIVGVSEFLDDQPIIDASEFVDGSTAAVRVIRQESIEEWGGSSVGSFSDTEDQAPRPGPSKATGGNGAKAQKQAGTVPWMNKPKELEPTVGYHCCASDEGKFRSTLSPLGASVARATRFCSTARRKASPGTSSPARSRSKTSFFAWRLVLASAARPNPAIIKRFQIHATHWRSRTDPGQVVRVEDALLRESDD